MISMPVSMTAKYTGIIFHGLIDKFSPLGRHITLWHIIYVPHKILCNQIDLIYISRSPIWSIKIFIQDKATSIDNGSCPPKILGQNLILSVDLASTWTTVFGIMIISKTEIVVSYLNFGRVLLLQIFLQGRGIRFDHIHFDHIQEHWISTSTKKSRKVPFFYLVTW